MFRDGTTVSWDVFVKMSAVVVLLSRKLKKLLRSTNVLGNELRVGNEASVESFGDGNPAPKLWRFNVEGRETAVQGAVLFFVKQEDVGSG